MNRRRLIQVGGLTLTVILVAALAVWWFVLRSNAPPAVSLDEAVSAATTAPGDTSPVGSAPQSIDGSWATVDGNGSFAGYRVEEELARVGFTTAAARTDDLTARLVIDGDTVTTVEVTVNMQALRSDSDRRDGAIRDQALETNAFPRGAFTLTEPVALPPGAASGEPFMVTAVGRLELHGVTNQVSMALEAQLIDDVIAVVGSAPVLFADYGIDPPSSLALLSVDDHGEMEFQLLFARG